jgi:hypothetical protein
MSIVKRIRRMAGEAFSLGVVLVSDAIDSWSAQETRQQLLDRLHENAQRGAVLALENEALKDEVDGLRFNGPTLYRDEVTLLEEYAAVLKTSLAFNNVESPEERQRDLKIIRSLLDRCDHAPMTADELAQQVEDIANGRVKLHQWEDVFGPNDPGHEVDPCDHTDAWGSLIGDDGSCMMCGQSEERKSHG